MRFGLVPYDLGLEKSAQHADCYQQFLEQAVLAEETGFDSVWLGENHFTSTAVNSSAEALGAAVATVTEGIRIGIIPALGLNNPLYIAEDVAVLDSIANGRVIVAARTPYAHECASLGINPQEIRGRFIEAFDVLRKAWAPSSFSHQGTFWRIPGQDFSGNPFAQGVTKVNVVPKPAQLAVPLWVFCWGSSTIDLASSLGAPWLGPSVDSVQELAHKHETYNAVFGNSSMARGNLLSPVIREVYLGETLEEARADAERGLLELYRKYREAGLFAGPVDDFSRLAGDRFIIGDVDHVIDEIGRYQREAGINYLICRMQFPGMSHDKAKAAIKFFGQAVIPEFRMDSFPREIRKHSRRAESGEQR